jgi:hypothetical protein
VASIVPAPSGVVSAASVQPNGTVWVLSGNVASKTLNQIAISTGKQTQAIGVSAAADSVSESPTGLLAIGLATATTGAVEFLNGGSGALVGSVAVGAPVRALAFGVDGITLYVLDGSSSSTSISVINSSTQRTSQTFGAPPDAIGLSPDPSQRSIWTVEASGNVQQTSLMSTKPIQQIPIGGPGIAVALSNSGRSLFVLKGDRTAANIDLIAIAGDKVRQVLPAAANSVGLITAATGSALYDVVGSPQVGNLQAIRLPADV